MSRKKLPYGNAREICPWKWLIGRPSVEVPFLRLTLPWRLKPAVRKIWRPASEMCVGVVAMAMAMYPWLFHWQQAFAGAGLGRNISVDAMLGEKRFASQIMVEHHRCGVSTM